MKIAIITSLYYPNIIGGAEKSTQVLVESLKKFKHNPIVITISDKECVENVNGIKVYYINYSNIYWSYYSKTKNIILKLFWHFFSLYNPIILKKVSAIIDLEKPEIVNTNNLAEFSVGVWKVVKKKKLPLIHTLRDFSLVCPRGTLFKRNNVCNKKNIICLMFLKFRKYFSKYVDTVVGNSNFVINEHIKSGFFKHSRKYVVYNSLDLPNITNEKKTFSNIVFGYIGQLSFHKGIEFLLDVFINENSAYLYIFGKGITTDYEKYLKKKYDSERINFYGYMSTNKALKMINVLIVPSLCLDVLPRVIFEAYSYGVPVIGSNRGGIPEIIDIGKTGFVYNAEEKKDLYEKIRYFVENPEIIDKMAPNCIKKAYDFVPERLANDYISIYNKTIDGFNK